MLSFLSPLIESNIEEKNKRFYKSKKEINKTKINELNNKTNESGNEFKANETEYIWNRGLDRKYSNNSNNRLKISKKNTLVRNGKEINFERKKYHKLTEKKFEGIRKSKYDIPEINELKKNRYFSRTKNNFRNTIVARDISSKSIKSNK